MITGLSDALNDLRTAMLVIRHATGFQTPVLTKLCDAVETLGTDRPARPLICPDEYLRAWRKLAAGSQIELGTRAVRYLSWEPEAVLAPPFHYYLEDQGFNLGARGIQGLVRACHLRWEAFLGDDTMQRIAVRHLRSYHGSNRIVMHWQAEVGAVLGIEAPDVLAAWMLEGFHSPQATATEWGIDTNTAFFFDTMHGLLKKARAQWRNSGDVVSFICEQILAWELWPIQTLKAEIAESILHPDANSLEVNDRLATFILRHPKLGDPRLPQNRTNWLGVRDEAKQRLIEWLSRADIVFFFDHAFPRGGDPHRRKPFWLKYVKRVRTSRPLLSPEDAMRLRIHLRQNGGEIGNFGKIIGTNSVFLLDFGEVCAVEFNHIGACYIYERRAMEKVVPDFFTSQYFKEHTLKNRRLCVTRIIHKPGWHEQLQQVLARFGVRP